MPVLPALFRHLSSRGASRSTGSRSRSWKISIPSGNRSQRGGKRTSDEPDLLDHRELDDLGDGRRGTGTTTRCEPAAPRLPLEGFGADMGTRAIVSKTVKVESSTREEDGHSRSAM